MDDFNSETDSDYTSYWRDWVSFKHFHTLCAPRDQDLGGKNDQGSDKETEGTMFGYVNNFTGTFRSDIYVSRIVR